MDLGRRQFRRRSRRPSTTACPNPNSPRAPCRRKAAPISPRPMSRRLPLMCGQSATRADTADDSVWGRPWRRKRRGDPTPAFFRDRLAVRRGIESERRTEDEITGDRRATQQADDMRQQQSVAAPGRVRRRIADRHRMYRAGSLGPNSAEKSILRHAQNATSGKGQGSSRHRSCLPEKARRRRL